MKKLLLSAVAIVLVIGIGAAVAAHYQNTKNKNVVTSEPTVSVKEADKRVQDAKTAAGAEYQSLVVKYNTAVAECQKGVGAYAKLTAFVKGQTAQPVCPEPVATQ